MRVPRRRPGDPFRVGAGEWNAIAATVDAVQAMGGDAPGTPGPLNPCIVEAKNEALVDLDAHECVLLDDILFGPSDNADEFKYATRLKLNLPDGYGKCGITLEPIASHAIGKVAVAGLAVAWLDVKDPGARFASDVQDETHLETTPTGPFRIVWREGGSSGVEWCVVRIEGAIDVDFDAVVTATSARGTSPQSWTYTIKRSDCTFSTNTHAAATGAPGLSAINKSEASGAYQHGQSLSPAGATLTPSAVSGPVTAKFLKWESGVRVYCFDAPNPMSLTCP